MPGLGRKTWSPGDTLTASDVNGYLMDQSVMVFAGTAARSSAIPTPSAGMVAYSTATQLQVYNGTAWVDLSTGYGAASGGSATSITAGGTAYTLLTFTSDATLTVSKSGLFDAIIVGGGGGGGYSAGPLGGGGGGGVIRSTYFVTAGSYAIRVAAGQGSAGATGHGSSIENVAYVGGGGGSNGHATPTGGQGAINAGGCGGFNTGANSSCMRGITSTIYGGGFDGGANPGATGGSGGGGGGAGGVGGNPNGGAGVDQSDFFGNVAGTNRFGGGGGSSSGSDGTGNGANNTGGGAKGGGHSGYSGVVYIRFKV